MAFGKAKADIEALQRRACATDAQKRAVVDGRSAGSGAGGWALIGGVCVLPFGALAATGLMAAGVVGNPFGAGTQISTPSDAVAVAASRRTTSSSSGGGIRNAFGSVNTLSSKECSRYTVEQIVEAKLRTEARVDRGVEDMKEKGRGAGIRAHLNITAGSGAKDFRIVMCAMTAGFATPPDTFRRKNEGNNAYKARVRREERRYRRELKVKRTRKAKIKALLERRRRERS